MSTPALPNTECHETLSQHHEELDDLKARLAQLENVEDIPQLLLQIEEVLTKKRDALRVIREPAAASLFIDLDRILHEVCIEFLDLDKTKEAASIQAIRKRLRNLNKGESSPCQPPQNS
jgi:hypothetical protein